jgi:hypothetical protein
MSGNNNNNNNDNNNNKTIQTISCIRVKQPLERNAVGLARIEKNGP